SRYFSFLPPPQSPHLDRAERARSPSTLALPPPNLARLPHLASASSSTRVPLPGVPLAKRSSRGWPTPTAPAPAQQSPCPAPNPAAAGLDPSMVDPHPASGHARRAGQRGRGGWCQGRSFPSRSGPCLQIYQAPFFPDPWQRAWVHPAVWSGYVMTAQRPCPSSPPQLSDPEVMDTGVVPST
ncbi:unnamed protein product, partial [Urochloa humidicola]